MFYTHSKQLHWYRNRYFFTQVCIQLLSQDEADYGDDADHKSTNVGLWDEVAHLRYSLAKRQEKECLFRKMSTVTSAHLRLLCLTEKTVSSTRMSLFRQRHGISSIGRCKCAYKRVNKENEDILIGNTKWLRGFSK